MPAVGPVNQQDAVNMIANYIEGVEAGKIGEEVGRKGTVQVKGAVQTDRIKDCLETAKTRFLAQTTEIVDHTTKPTVPNPPIAPMYGVLPYDPDDPPVVMRYGIIPPPDADTAPPPGDAVALYAVRPVPVPTPDDDAVQLSFLRTVLQGGAKQVDAIFGNAIGTMEKALKGGHLTSDEVTAMKAVVEGYQAARGLVNDMLALHGMMDD